MAAEKKQQDLVEASKTKEIAEQVPEEQSKEKDITAATPQEEQVNEKESTVAAPTGEQPKAPTKSSAKNKYLQRYAKAHPDMKPDDEDSFYGKANENLDELEGYRKNNKELSDAFGKNPTLSAMLLAAKDGENPFVWLGENLGMDIKELSDDPEFGKKLGDALIKYQQKQSEGKKAQKEIETNFQTSISELQKVATENSLSEDEAKQLYTKFFEEIVDPATRGIVSKETWELMRKGMKYDTDIEAATQKASAKALNQKIENKVSRGTKEELPPTLSTGTTVSPTTKKRKGFFSDTRDL